MLCQWKQEHCNDDNSQFKQHLLHKTQSFNPKLTHFLPNIWLYFVLLTMISILLINWFCFFYTALILTLANLVHVKIKNKIFCFVGMNIKWIWEMVYLVWRLILFLFIYVWHYVSACTYRTWTQKHLNGRQGHGSLTEFMIDISSGIMCVCNVTAAAITALSPLCPPISGPAAACVRLLCTPQVSVSPCRKSFIFQHAMKSMFETWFCLGFVTLSSSCLPVFTPITLSDSPHHNSQSGCCSLHPQRHRHILEIK